MFRSSNKWSREQRLELGVFERIQALERMGTYLRRLAAHIVFVEGGFVDFAQLFQHMPVNIDGLKI